MLRRCEEQMALPGKLLADRPPMKTRKPRVVRQCACGCPIMTASAELCYRCRARARERLRDRSGRNRRKPDFTTRAMVLEFFRAAPSGATTEEAVKRFGTSKEAMSKRLSKMVKLGLLNRTGIGRYEAAKK